MLGGYTVNVEVVGTCNLKCPSCPVGNYADRRGAGSIGGTMPVAQFERIIGKLAAELRGRQGDVFIALYSWGEPLIHPRIGEVIGIARAAGFRVGLSSNLNYERHLAQALAAGPDEFVVSLSGFTQEHYAESHAGGDIERVKRNMRALAALVAEHGHRTRVYVHYHCYTHNTGDDVRQMAQLCEALRFAFLPGIAYYMPVENLLRAAAGAPPPGDAAIIDRLLVPLPEQLAIAAAHAADATGCDLLETRLDIDVDGAVKLCCATYDRTTNVATDFLAVPFDEVQARRNAAALCGSCLRHGINRIYTLKDYPLWQGVANRTLAALERPIRFEPGGSHVIEGLDTETTLLGEAVQRMNAGELEAAAAVKARLDALIGAKYGAAMRSIEGLRAGLARGGWSRGATLPENPLLYFFVAAVLLRNREHAAGPARALLDGLRELADGLAADAGYRAHATEMCQVIDEWRALPS
jgi:MoaA/NifB/PqqE/SkfB family radical SAM enzyme